MPATWGILSYEQMYIPMTTAQHCYCLKDKQKVEISSYCRKRNRLSWLRPFLGFFDTNQVPNYKLRKLPMCWSLTGLCSQCIISFNLQPIVRLFWVFPYKSFKIIRVRNTMLAFSKSVKGTFKKATKGFLFLETFFIPNPSTRFCPIFSKK